jgi:CubicO group peptidase (beta-lactamase class C family)
VLPPVAEVVAAAVGGGPIVGASVLVARDGEVVHEQHAGWADREARVPVAAGTVFRLASLTKPIVSATTLALADAGAVALDAPVRELLPALADGITLRHLLTHTAGLTYGFLTPDGEPYRSAGVSDGLDAPGITLAENVARIGRVPLAFAPGTAWRYSVGVDVAGAVLEAATGETLPALVARHVTGPLGMRDTAFVAADPARLAVAYADDAPPRRMAAADEVALPDAGAVRYAPGRALDPSAFPSGGAGMVGTARDLLVFLEALRRGGAPILAPQAARLMVTDQVPGLLVDAAGPGFGFGFGFAVLRDPVAAGSPRAVGACGWGGVYGTSAFFDPRAGLTVVSLSNTAIAGMEGDYPDALERAVYAAAAGDSPKWSTGTSADRRSGPSRA